MNLSITSRSSQLSLESRVTSGTSAKSGKKRNDLERCDPLAVPRGDKPTKLSCFNHFTSFYLIFLPNFCSLPRSQPTGEEGKTHNTDRHDNNCHWHDSERAEVMDLCRTFLAFNLSCLGDFDGKTQRWWDKYRTIQISKTFRQLSRLFVENDSESLGGGLSKIFYFHPLSLGFHDPIWLAHIFHMGWFNHQIKAA